MSLESALDVVERVAPNDGVDADSGSLSQDRDKLLGGVSGRLFAPARKTEIIFRLAQLSEALQPIQEKEQRGFLRFVSFLPAFDFAGHFRENSLELSAVDQASVFRTHRGQFRPKAGMRCIVRRAIQYVKLCAVRGPLRTLLRGQA